MAKTKQPKIASITRSGYKFTVKWKHGEKDYTDQDVDFYVILRSEKAYTKATKKAKKDKSPVKIKKNKSTNPKKYKFIEKVKVKKGSTSASYSLKAKDYYPTSGKPKIVGVEFRVRGKVKKKDWSDYDYKTFDIDKPKKLPTISKSLDSSVSNRVVFTVSRNNDSDHYPIHDIEYKYNTVPNCNSYESSSCFSKWKEGHDKQVIFTTAAKNQPVDVYGYLTTSKTVVIWARSRGMGGNSEWKKTYHTFANPNAPIITNTELTVKEHRGRDLMDIYIKWKLADTIIHPSDTITPEYLIDVPDIEAVYTKTNDTKIDAKKSYYIWDEDEQEYVYYQPVSNAELADLYEYDVRFYPPEGKQWSQAPTETTKYYKNKTINDNTTITIPYSSPLDTCLWVRLLNMHDGNPNRSGYRTVRINDLVAPTITNIVLDDSPTPTYKATITATNNSAVAGSFIAIVYNSSNPESNYNGKVIGIIEEGTTETIQCPNWTNDLPISFGAYAIYGEINWKDTTSSTMSGCLDPINVYAFYTKMSSPISYKSGSTPNPVPASSVTLSPTNIPGTIQVGWNNPWQEATGTEVSWADHDDAWYSTDGPSSYTVNTISQPILNVSGLEEGKKWYIRVRFFKTNVDGNNIYGPYSIIYDLDLTRNPEVPILNIDPEDVATVDTDITASWVYVTNDGTMQEYAELAYVHNVYTLTEDVEIDESKQYYILVDDEYVLVSDPVVEDISAYYEITDHTYSKFLSTETAQHITFAPNGKGINWEAGHEYTVALRVRSASGQFSDYSEFKTIKIAEPAVCTIESTNLVKRDETITSYELTEDTEIDPLKTYYIFDESAPGNGYVEVDTPVVEDISTYYEAETSIVSSLYLTHLPLEVTVSGAGVDGMTGLSIERADSINLDNPDESEYIGYDKETVYQDAKNGDNPFVITLSNLMDYGTLLNDGGKYRLIASIQDSAGQIAPDDTITVDGQEFEYFQVEYDHQAIIPDGEVEVANIDGSTVGLIKANLPSELPTGWELEDGDHLDIYRLSAGKPELIYQGAKFYDENNPKETTYVDPYPTIGKRGGYRIVFVTGSGDYYAPVTEDGQTYDVPAWTDIMSGFDTKFQYINFDEREIEFRYNVRFSNSWNKQFTGTHYLGGNYVGDWLAGTEHTNSITGNVIDNLEEDTLNAIYDLAEYDGVCRIRTIEGANFAANITVSDSSEFNSPDHIHSITLNVTKVDNAFGEATTLGEWEAE